MSNLGRHDVARRRLLGAAALLALAALAGVAWWPAPASAPADFALPAPGSYALQRITAAPAGTVLDTDGKAWPLVRFTTGKVTLLSFIYTRCTDPDGCPHAAVVMHLIQGAAGANPALAGKVRLVSLSFDPAHDTPEVMRRYGGGEAGAPPSRVPWHFLTTDGPQALVPLLGGFGQDVSVVAGLADGGHEQHGAAPDDGDLSHLLKVFLIDADGMVREVYTTAYLRPEVVMNDIETLVLEAGAAGPG